MKASKQHIFIFILVLLSLFAVYKLYPTKKYAEISPIIIENVIPKSLPGWSLVPDDQRVISSEEQSEYIKSIYSQTLSRTYINTFGQRIMLSIAYTDNQSDNSGKQSHKPEICYPAQGLSIVFSKNEVVVTKFGNISVKKLIAESEHRIEPITYWTMVGNNVANNTLAVKKEQFRLSLDDVLADGLIFRVSSIDSNIESASKLQDEFINSLLNAVESKVRNRISGL